MPTCAHLCPPQVAGDVHWDELTGGERARGPQAGKATSSPQTQARAFLGTLPDTPKFLWSNMFPNPLPTVPCRMRDMTG